MIKSAQVSLPSDTEVRVTRDFKAPRQLVWQCHTDPALFRRWIGGMPGWSMPVCANSSKRVLCITAYAWLLRHFLPSTC